MRKKGDSLGKLLFSNSGFTLVEAIVAALVLSLIGLATTQLILNQYRMNGTVQALERAQATLMLSRMALSQPATCLQNFNGKSFAVLKNDPPTNFTVSSSSGTLIQPGGELAGGIRVKASGGVAFGDRISEETTTGKSIVSEIIILANKEANLFGSGEVKYRIPMKFIFDTSGSLASCYSELSSSGGGGSGPSSGAGFSPVTVPVGGFPEAWCDPLSGRPCPGYCSDLPPPSGAGYRECNPCPRGQVPWWKATGTNPTPLPPESCEGSCPPRPPILPDGCIPQPP